MRVLAQLCLHIRHGRASAAALLIVIGLTACGSHDACVAQPATTSVGNPQRGVALIRQYGCGACHEIPGIEDADGLVGPPLGRMAGRIYIAGVLRNTPESMMAWLRDPQAIVPGNAMPNMGLSAQDARDVTAYLYTLR